MHIQPYPYLSEYLGAYVHQDAFDDGESDDDIQSTIAIGTPLTI